MYEAGYSAKESSVILDKVDLFELVSTRQRRLKAEAMVPGFADPKVPRMQITALVVRRRTPNEENVDP